MAYMMFTSKPWQAARSARRSLLVDLAVLIALIMPLVSASIFPTYRHIMTPPALEWMRLIELPFALCEAGVIYFAVRRGMRVGDYFQGLPRDIKVAFALLVIGLFVSSGLVSSEPMRSIEISVITLLHLQFAMAVYHLALRDRLAGVEWFVPILGVGVAVLGVVTAAKFLLPPPASAIPGGKIEWQSALPGFISVRHFGAWTGAVAGGLLFGLLYPAGKDRRFAISLLYVIAACLTAWSGTRAAVAAVAAVAVVVLLTLRRLPQSRDLYHAVMLSGVALVLAYCLPAPSPAFWLFDHGSLDSADEFTSGRLELWRATYHRWLDAPLFGWGSGSTFWEVYVGWTQTQPHNVILQFLISWGLIGAAGGLWLIGRALHVVHRTGLTDPMLRPLTAVVYVLLFQSLVEGMLHYPRFIMMIATGLAIILAHRNSVEDSSPQG